MKKPGRATQFATAGALVLAGFGGGAVLAATGSADAATKVKTAALAKYPGATIERQETASDGIYEAHIVMPTGRS